MSITLQSRRPRSALAQPSNKVLRIFLSHKLGKSKEKAKRVAAALSVLANDKMTITYSADFDRGDEWEIKIRQGLDSSDWFILLYDGPDSNHDWCLWEAGYFRAHMDSLSTKKLICLHDPRHSLPGPLRGFTSVPAREDEVYELFKQVYLDPPWQLRPELFAETGQEEIREKARRIIRELSHADEIVAQFTLSPTFTFNVKKESVGALANGKIPLDTVVNGDGPWEIAFGKPAATVAWTWGQLVEGLLDWEPWAHQLAGMMDDAYKVQFVPHPSLALRIKLKVGTEGIYRVILRRYDKTVEEMRFTFGAAKIITAYQPNNHVKETRIFHLYNMAWFFKRQFLEKHLEALRELNVLKTPHLDKVEEEVRSIMDDLKAFHAEAQVRGVEDPARLIQAFDGPLRAKVDEALQVTWPILDGTLIEACRQPARSLPAIIKAIEAMENINEFFLKVCLEELLKFSSLQSAEGRVGPSGGSGTV